MEKIETASPQNEIAKQLFSFFSEIKDYHGGFEVPYNKIKKHEFVIVPKDEMYAYTVSIGISPSTRELYIEIHVGIMSKILYFKGDFESVKDLCFDYEEVEGFDEDGDKFYRDFIVLKVKNECVFKMEL